LSFLQTNENRTFYSKQEKKHGVALIKNFSQYLYFIEIEKNFLPNLSEVVSSFYFVKNNV